MEITPTDRSVIEKLRREHEWHQRWGNWMRLLMGFGSLGISIWAVGMSAQFDSALTLGQISAIKPEAAAYALEWNGNLMTMVAVLYVGAFVFFFMGILVLTFAIIRWRPSPAEILLLKLVDQQLAEETSRRA